MRLLVITANDIDQAGITFEQALPTEWLDAELAESGARATAAGSARARLSRSGKSDIIVRGEVHASVELPCARCLKPTPIVVDGELSLLLKARPGMADGARAQDRRSSRGAGGAPEKPAAKAAPSVAKQPAVAKGPAVRGAPKGGKAAARLAEYEFTSEEADLDEYDGDTVVLDAFVREALLLELPNFPLCSDACPGISRTPWRSEAATAEPVRVNPFEALKHLRPSLGSGGGDASPEELRLGGDAPHVAPRTAAPKLETKIASTHAAPLLRPSSKRPSSKQKQRLTKGDATKKSSARGSTSARAGSKTVSKRRKGT